MTPLQQDDIILQAALQFGPDYLYTIKNGSLGTTLYIHVGKKEEAHITRRLVPMKYEGLRTVVTYTNRRDEI